MIGKERGYMAHTKKRKNIKFEVVCNCCVICHRKTLDPNPFYICKECKEKLKADKNYRTSEYDTNVNKELGILGGV